MTKDSTKWNFEMLQELIEGPFLHPKRLEEAIKIGKFMRRLMAFFHPFSHRFSDMSRKPVSFLWLMLDTVVTLPLSRICDGCAWGVLFSPPFLPVQTAFVSCCKMTIFSSKS